MKILIVDDDEICRRLLVRGLQLSNYQTVEAEDVPGALEVLQQEEGIRLLITDVIMPGMGGFDLVERLRKTISMRRLPVIVCTALATHEAAIRATQLNAVGYLIKPIDVADLRLKVKEALDPHFAALSDSSEILKSLDIEEDAYKDLLDDLVKKLASGLAEISDLVEQEDRQLLSSRLVALYGAARTLGAKGASGILLKQARASEKGDLGTVKSLIPEIEKQATMLREAVSELGDN